MTKHVDDSYDQAAEADGAKAVGQSTSGCASCYTLWHIVAAEVPAAVYSGDDGVDRILEPLGNPVCGKSDEDYETDDSSRRAAARALITGRIVTRIILDVYGYQSDREPCTKCRSEKSPDE